MCVKAIIFSDVISMPSSARMSAEYVAVRLVEAISTKDVAGVISIIDSWVRSGSDPRGAYSKPIFISDLVDGMPFRSPLGNLFIDSCGPSQP